MLLVSRELQDDPYKALPPRSFGKTAVVEKNFMEFGDVYRKKYSISKTDRVVTAGTCFVQHIARHLRKSGFDYKEYETAPPSFPENLLSSFGYGLFSERYANIYTVRQLLQLFERAFGGFSPAEDIWESDGRSYDPFRPTVEPNGFASQRDGTSTAQPRRAAGRASVSSNPTPPMAICPVRGLTSGCPQQRGHRFLGAFTFIRGLRARGQEETQSVLAR